MAMRTWAFAPFMTTGAAALCLLGLAACDGAPSATPARAHASVGSDRRLADDAPLGGDTRSTARASNAAYASGSGAGGRADDAPLFHGKPMWAANKNHSARENADYHFKRDGEAMGATSEDDFLTKVHAFVDAPPKGTEVLTRANGDRLLYDPKANLFAVVDKDGAPRTLFKPRNGAAYWDQQKDSLDQGNSGSRPKSARRGSGEDNG